MFGISLYNTVILYANLYRAKDHPDVGYLDCDRPSKEIAERLKISGFQLKQSELEACLWACTQLFEIGDFWHPAKVPLGVFINQIINPKRVQKHYDRVYSQIKEITKEQLEQRKLKKAGQKDV